MVTVRRLQYWWRGFNDAVFGGSLHRVKIQLGRLEPDWIGGYDTDDGIYIAPELSEEDAMSTLLHEMIHQWQHENDLPLSHGNSFRKWSKVCRLCTGLSV